MSQLRTFISFGLLSLIFLHCAPDNIQALHKTIDPEIKMPLEDILFINDSVGYAVGGKAYNKGIILSTKNGGLAWKMDTLFDHALWAISSNHSNELNAVGFSGNFFIKKENEPWSFYRLPIWHELTGTLFDKNGGAFLSSGSSFKAGKIIHLNSDYSVDTIFEMQNEIQQIAYSDSNSLVAVGYAAVFNSTNNGRSWTRNTLNGDYFLDVQFPETQTGFIIGFSGTIFKTIDGGISWKKLKSSGNLLFGEDTFLSMAFRNADVGYVCGQFGLLMKTTDGGNTWQKYERFTEEHLTGICLTNHSIWLTDSSGKIHQILSD